jgi:hypothetical protein
MTQEEKNQQVIREFTRIFKNEHNVDGVGHLSDRRLTPTRLIVRVISYIPLTASKELN